MKIPIFSQQQKEKQNWTSIFRQNAKKLALFFFCLLGLSNALLASSEKPFTGSPEKYYNEALVKKEEGNLPEASLALRRALVLDPTLIVAQQELGKVLTKMSVPMDTASWQQRIAVRFAPARLSLIGMIIGWGATLALVIFFFLQILPSSKGSKKWGLFSFLVFFCIMGHALSVLGVITDPRLHARYEVVVLPKEKEPSVASEKYEGLSIIPLRATPADTAPALAQIPTGSLLILLSQHGAWSFVRTSRGEEGWMVSATLEPLIPKNKK